LDFFTSEVKMLGLEQFCSYEVPPKSCIERLSKLLMPISVDVLVAQKITPRR